MKVILCLCMSDIPIPIYLFQYLYITKFYLAEFSRYWGKAGFAKYSFINHFLFTVDITSSCFYFAFNFCNIFVNIAFRPSTLNQNLMQFCIIDFMEWEYVFCACPAVSNLFCLVSNSLYSCLVSLAQFL